MGIGENGNEETIKLSRRNLRCAVLSCGQPTEPE